MPDTLDYKTLADQITQDEIIKHLANQSIEEELKGQSAKLGNPSSDTTPVSKPPSPLGSSIRSFIRNVPSSAISGGAAFGIGSLLDLTGIGAPIGIPLQILGAGLAGYGASRLQRPVLQKVLPEETYNKYVQSENQDILTNPKSSAIGAFGSMIASGVSPSVPNVFKAAGTGMRVLGGRTLQSLPSKELINLRNVGISGAINPALQAAQSKLTGQPIDAKDLIGSSLAGMVFNRPWIGGSRNLPPKNVEGNFEVLPKELPKVLPKELPTPKEQKQLTYKEPLQLENQKLIEQLAQEAIQKESLKNAAQGSSVEERNISEYKGDNAQLPAEGDNRNLPSTEHGKSAETSSSDSLQQSKGSPVEKKTISPLLTEAVQRGSDIYMSFDITGKVPTAQELTSLFKEKGHNVEFLQFEPNVFSTSEGVIKFRGVAAKPEGQYSEEVAKNAFKDIFGRSEDLRAKSETAKSIPFNERLSKSAKFYQNQEVGLDIIKPKEETIKATLKLPSSQSTELYAGIPNPIKALKGAASYVPSSLGPGKPQLQKVREQGPTGEYVANQLNKFYFDKDKLQGLGYDFASKAQKYSSDERANVNTYLHDMMDYGASKVKLTPAEVILKDEFRNFIQHPQYTQSGLPKPTIQVNPNYIPQKMTPEVIQKLLNEPSSLEAAKLRNDFVDYQVNQKGVPLVTAKKRLDEISQSFKNPEIINRASQFRPLDKAEGYGIPRSWREMDLLRNVQAYSSRAARRLSYFNNIEKDPIMREALGINSDPLTGKPSILGNKLPTGELVTPMAANEQLAPVMKDVEGRFSSSSVKVAVVQRLVRSGMMGTMTGTSNLIGSQAQGFKFMTPLQVLPATIKGWIGINKAIKESTLAGVNRPNLSSLEFRDSEFADPITHLNDISNIANSVQGKNFLERLARANSWNQGKYLAMSNIWEASKTGGKMDSQRTKFLDTFGPENWKSYIKQGAFPPEVLNDIASKYVNSTQGTYDYRELPRIANESSWWNPLGLSRWGIGQANRFMTDVVVPLKNGDPKPILMSTLGAILGGTAIEQMLEKVTGRKSSTPTYRELKEGLEDKNVTVAREGEAIFYKVAGLSSLAGSAGILWNLAKSALDVMHGNKTMPVNDPLWSAIEANSVNVAHAIQAISEGEPDVGVNFITEFLKNNIQEARLIMSQFSEDYQRQISEGNKSRDLKVFRQLHGYQQGGDPGGQGGNPYLNQDLRRFRESTNMDEIISSGQKLLTETLNKNANSPGLLINELSHLRSRSRNNMPSRSNPVEFIQYLDWIGKTQGEKAKQELLNNYMNKKALDEAIGELIP